MSATEESTKNIKGNRKFVHVKFVTYGAFKIPDGLDLEDETVVKSWGVSLSTLYISYVDGREEEVECEWDVASTMEAPEWEKIDDAEEWGIEYSEDEEEEEGEEEEVKK